LQIVALAEELRQELKNAPNSPDSPAVAAARIRLSEAEAGLRREKVKYLGTVDASFYPEAELAVVQALRADPNESVRLEAALALGQGNCFTKTAAAALTETVTGTKRFGPPENSARVKEAAKKSLQAFPPKLLPQNNGE
jgi:hypothetical protein